MLLAPENHLKGVRAYIRVRLMPQGDIYVVTYE